MAMRSLGYMPSEVELAIIMQRLDMDGKSLLVVLLPNWWRGTFPVHWSPSFWLTWFAVTGKVWRGSCETLPSLQQGKGRQP